MSLFARALAWLLCLLGGHRWDYPGGTCMDCGAEDDPGEGGPDDGVRFA